MYCRGGEGQHGARPGAEWARRTDSRRLGQLAKPFSGKFCEWQDGLTRRSTCGLSLHATHLELPAPRIGLGLTVHTKEIRQHARRHLLTLVIEQVALDIGELGGEELGRPRSDVLHVNLIHDDGGSFLPQLMEKLLGKVGDGDDHDGMLGREERVSRIVAGGESGDGR